MRCEQIWDMLSAYADNEATGNEAAIVETHIAVCFECAADLQFMRSASGSLAGVPEVDPPATLRSSILAATVYSPTRQSWQRRLRFAWASAFSFRGLRYASLAGAAAMSAWVALRWTPSPVTSVKQNPSPTSPAKQTAPTVDVPDASALFSQNVTADIEVPAVAPPMSRVADANASPRRSPVSRRSPAATRSENLALVRSAFPRTGSASPVVTAPPEKPDIEPVEPSMDMLPATPRTAVADSGPARTPDSGEAVAPRPSSVPVALASYSESSPRTQLITLADLKRSLRRQAMDDRSRFITESINEKRIRFDVVRSRF